MTMNENGATMKTEKEERQFTAFITIKNLMVITITIMLVEAAIGPASDLDSSINISEGMGTTSAAVGYVFTIAAYFFLPTLVINKFGLKYSMVVFIALESIPTIANFYLSWWTLIPGSIVSSVAGVITRPAQKTSVALLAEKYAAIRGRDKYYYINIFFAVYYSIAYSGYVLGSVFSLEALNNIFVTSNASNTSLLDFGTCGARFYDPDHQSSQQFVRPSQNEIYTFYGISALGGTLASLVILFFLDYMKNPGGEGSNAQMMGETFRMFKKRDNLLLIPTDFQRGLMDGFISIEYTKAYITCSMGVHSVGIIMVTYYASQCVFSLLGPYAAKYVGRITVITFVAVLQGVLLVVLALYHPEPDQKLILHSLVALFGVASAVYQSVTSIMYSTLFAENRKAAFANFLLPTTIGTIVASAYSYYLTVWIKIIICSVFLVCSYVCYLGVEVPIIIRSRKAKEKAVRLQNFKK